MKRIATRSINILANKLRRRLAHLGTEGDYSGAKGRTLHYIIVKSECGDIFQKDIEDEFGLRSSTATNILKDMEKSGLIVREPCIYDARKKKIVLTAKALQYKDEVIRGLEQLEEEVTAGISQEDLEVFFSVIDRMLLNLREK